MRLRSFVAWAVSLVLVGSLSVGAYGLCRNLEKGRIYGANRVETSIAIAKAAFPGQAQSVYLARMDVFADALAGGALMDGPVLLVPRDGQVPGNVAVEIKRLNPKRVVALGGPAAVSEQMLASAAGGRETGRLGGADRVETSIKIATKRAEQAPVTEVYLADGKGDSGQGSPDPLAGGSLTKGGIYIYMPGSELRLKQAIDQVNAPKVMALGGPASVSEQHLYEMAGDRETGRLSGVDRYATASIIAQAAFPEGAEVAYIANSENYADAVSGGSLKDGPLLLVPSSGVVPESVKNAVIGLSAKKVVALGGPAAISEDVLDQAALRKNCGVGLRVTQDQVRQALIDKINANTRGYAPGKPLKKYSQWLETRAQGMFDDSNWSDVYPLTKYYADNAYNRAFQRLAVSRNSSRVCGKYFEGYGRIDTSDCFDSATCVIDHIRNADIFLPHRGRTALDGSCVDTFEGSSLATDSNTEYGIAVEITPNQVRYAWKAE